jgi:hypothetical protein
MVNLNALSRTVTDTMGIPLAILLPAPPSWATVGRVFAAFAEAYAELKIPTEIRDSLHLQLGNPQFYRRFDLGGKSLSLYLDCGQDVDGIWAEIYRISISLVTFLTPKGGDSLEVRSVLLAQAVDIPKSIRTKDCGSTGELERRLYQMALKSLAQEGYRKPR